MQFLRQSYVPCNVRRTGETYSLVLPKRALRKKAVFAGEYTELAGSTNLRLTVGPKFDLGAYLGSFGGRGHHRWAQVAFSDLVW